MLVKDFHDRIWWPDCERRLRECTLVGYRGAWEASIERTWGSWNLEDIKPSDIEDWLRNGFSKPTGGANAFTTLRAMCSYAVKMEILDKSPCKLVRTPWSDKKKVKKPQPVLDKDQIRELIDGLRGSCVEPFVICTLTLGLRKEEGCALEWSDINLKTGEVSITKGAQWVNGREVINPPKTKNSYRVLFLPEFALLRMREIHAELVDAGELHPRITFDMNPNQVTFNYQREIRERNLPYVPPKNLRHSWATCALRAGVPISTVSKHLGHYDISVTANHYIVACEQDFRNAQKVFQKEVVPDAITSVSADEIGRMSFSQRLKLLFKGEV